jgi:hypothetical protein
VILNSPSALLREGFIVTETIDGWLQVRFKSSMAAMSLGEGTPLNLRSEVFNIFTSPELFSK